jgi:hypothetical protein
MPITDRPAPFLKAFLLFTIPIILGLGAGISFSFLNVENWRQIEKPPDTPVKLIDANQDKLLMQTTDGIIYLFVPVTNSLDEHRIQKGNWLPVKEGDPNFKIPVDIPCDYKAIYIPPLPGKVIDSIQRSVCFVEGAVDVRYVITENGTIWQWISNGSLGNFIDAAFYGFIGTVSGFIIGFIVLVIYARNKA